MAVSELHGIAFTDFKWSLDQVHNELLLNIVHNHDKKMLDKNPKEEKNISCKVLSLDFPLKNSLFHK